MLQVGDRVLGRARLFKRDTEVSHALARLDTEVPERLDLYFSFGPWVQRHIVPFEGRCWYRSRLSSELDLQGVIRPTDETISIEVREKEQSHELVLQNCFYIEDITKDEVWNEFFQTHLVREKPWTLLISHDKLQNSLKTYLEANEGHRNVFVMMRFSKTEENQRIRNAIAQSLREADLVPQFADTVSFADDLWENVCTYMLGSRYGIAVIEQVEERNFNPNVAIEIGYMLALQRRLLVLKDRRVPSVPTDLIGRVYREFDSYKIEETVSAQVAAWVEELRILQDFPYRYQVVEYKPIGPDIF